MDRELRSLERRALDGDEDARAALRRARERLGEPPEVLHVDAPTWMPDELLKRWSDQAHVVWSHEGFRRLCSQTQLQGLELTQSAQLDPDWVPDLPPTLSDLVRLQALELVISEQASTNAGTLLESVGRLHRLRALRIEGTQLPARSLAALGQLPELESLSLVGFTKVSTDDLEELRPIDSLQDLGFSGCSIDATRFQPLSRTPALRSLSVLGGARLEGISQFCQPPSLRELRLGELAPRSLGTLAPLRETELEELELDGLAGRADLSDGLAPILPETLRSLRLRHVIADTPGLDEACPRLETLDVRITPFSSGALSQLAGLPLRELSLDLVDDMRPIARISTLERLELDAGPVGELQAEDLMPLQDLPRLRAVRVSGSMTPEAMAVLAGLGVPRLELSMTFLPWKLLAPLRGARGLRHLRLEDQAMGVKVKRLPLLESFEGLEELHWAGRLSRRETSALRALPLRSCAIEGEYFVTALAEHPTLERLAVAGSLSNAQLDAIASMPRLALLVTHGSVHPTWKAVKRLRAARPGLQVLRTGSWLRERLGRTWP